MKRTIIIGDIHGCLRELESLLLKVNFNQETDRLISVGDLINKGPYSADVLRLWRHLKAEVVIGNHELSFLRNRHHQEKRDWHKKLILELGHESEEYLDWLQTWPAYLESHDFIVVHGGIVPNMPLQETPREWLTSIRTWDGRGDDLNNPNHPAWYGLYEGNKLVVYGHWAAQGLKIKRKTIGLDSGCCYGRQLSALILPERKIIQQTAYDTYQFSK